MKCSELTYDSLNTMYSAWVQQKETPNWLVKLAALPREFKDGFVLFVRNDLMDREITKDLLNKFAHIYLLSLHRVATDINTLQLTQVYKQYRTLNIGRDKDFGTWFKDSLNIVGIHE